MSTMSSSLYSEAYKNLRNIRALDLASSSRASLPAPLSQPTLKQVVSLTKPEEEALENYTSGDYWRINQYFRNLKASLKSFEQKLGFPISDLDTALEKRRTNAKVKTFRAVEQFDEHPEGSVFTEKAYLSTSKSPKTAERYSCPDLKTVQYTVFGHSSADIEASSIWGSEAERLYPRNSNFKVLFSHQVTPSLRKVVLDEII